MPRYANLGGDSGVRWYEIGQGSIEVAFRDGGVYVYTNASAGSYSIERMQLLARAGQGLNAFINTDVKKGYASKRQ